MIFTRLFSKSIRVSDFSFKKQFFHSASLVVREPPGGGEPDCFLVVVLFTHNGMREYGMKGSSLGNTIWEYQKLNRQLWIPKFTSEEINQLLAAKFQEVELHRAARARNTEAEKRATQGAVESGRARSEPATEPPRR